MSAVEDFTSDIDSWEGQLMTNDIYGHLILDDIGVSYRWVFESHYDEPFSMTMSYEGMYYG